MKREIVAFPVLIILYLYIMKLSEFFFFILLIFISLIAQAEFYYMYKIKNKYKLIGILFGGIFLCAIYLRIKEQLLIIIGFVIFIMLLRLFSSKKIPTGCLIDIAPVLLGFFYIPIILSLLIKIRQMGPEWIIFIGATVWCSDTFAYYIGKSIGKRKLFPTISPKKTIEGAIGSVIGGIVSAILLNMLILDNIDITMTAVLGIIIGCVTILGDLTESMFKRDSGVKDSSKLIPGHGGILDKLDGIIFVTPLIYFFLLFCK